MPEYNYHDIPATWQVEDEQHLMKILISRQLTCPLLVPVHSEERDEDLPFYASIRMETALEMYEYAQDNGKELYIFDRWNELPTLRNDADAGYVLEFTAN